MAVAMPCALNSRAHQMRATKPRSIPAPACAGTGSDRRHARLTPAPARRRVLWCGQGGRRRNRQGALIRSQAMLSRNLEKTLHRALAYANERRHQYATLEHLLLALTADEDAAAVLRACNVDIEKLCRDLTEYVDKLANLVSSDAGDDAKPTASFQRMLQRAAIHVQSSGR